MTYTITETPREALEKIIEYFSREGAKFAMAQGWECEYRTSDGRACAVGCLIPDDQYDPLMEGRALSINRWINCSSPDTERILVDAQKEHDSLAVKGRDVEEFVQWCKKELEKAKSELTQYNHVT